MNNRYIFEDIDEAQHYIKGKNFRVFEVLRGEANTFLTHKIERKAYRSIYHNHPSVEDNEWGINSLREEGIELYYDNTDFGLKEVIVTKIK